jgi:hypothetical protein
MRMDFEDSTRRVSTVKSSVLSKGVSSRCEDPREGTRAHGQAEVLPVLKDLAIRLQDDRRRIESSVKIAAKSWRMCERRSRKVEKRAFCLFRRLKRSSMTSTVSTET